MMLDDLGLAPTVKRYVDAYKEKSGIQTSLTVTGTERRLEPVREIMVFRGLQELLGNARNHAQASQVRIGFDMDDNRVRVVVEDSGKGFDVEAALSGGQQKTIGLASLKERITTRGRLKLKVRWVRDAVVMEMLWQPGYVGVGGRAEILLSRRCPSTYSCSVSVAEKGAA
jgi:two-component system sensor histidine kinase DegS